MSRANKTIARRFVEDVIGRGRLDAVDEIFTADYHDHDPANTEDTRGPRGVGGKIRTYRTAFPDLETTVEHQVAEADYVTTRWTARATQLGPLMGLAPSGRSVELSGITIHRFAAGRIQEGWWNWDTLGMLRQLGVIATPPDPMGPTGKREEGGR